MAGLQTGGFRPQAGLNVRPVNGADFAIDPNLLIRGFREGFKTGSDILTELDAFALRPKVQEAKKKSIEASTAASQKSIDTAASQTAAENTANNAAIELTPDMVTATKAGHKFDAAKATAFTPVQGALGELALGKAQAGLEQQDGVSPLDITEVKVKGTPVALSISNRATGQTDIQPLKTPVVKPTKVDEVTLWNPKTGRPERVAIFRDPDTGMEQKREVIGLAPEAGTNRMQSVQAKLNNLNASEAMATSLNQAIDSYLKTGKGGAYEGFVERATRMDPGLNPLKWGIKTMAGNKVDPSTTNLVGLMGNAVNTLKNSLFGAALTKYENEAAKGQFPSPDDISNPTLLAAKAKNLELFVKAQKAAYDPDNDDFVQAPPRGPVASAPADLSGVTVGAPKQPAISMPAEAAAAGGYPTITRAQIPAGARTANGGAYVQIDGKIYKVID